MQRAELTSPGEPLVVVDAPAPTVPHAGLLIKMLYSGVCQSDLKLATGHVDQGDSKKLNYLEKIGINLLVLPAFFLSGSKISSNQFCPKNYISCCMYDLWCEIPVQSQSCLHDRHV